MREATSDRQHTPHLDGAHTKHPNGVRTGQPHLPANLPTICCAEGPDFGSGTTASSA